jgi:VIT1/CCC1 family predicted Fe2+/Mn2+ transporter
MSKESETKRATVLDPFDRVSEVVFGVLMAMSFIGSLSVATAGSTEVRTMVSAALGCNLAWGLTDAVMFLIGELTERHRKVALLTRLHVTQDLQEAHRLIASELPERLAAGAGPDALEGLRTRLLALTVPRRVLGWRDVRAAVAVFLLVALSTFPVVLPFLVVRDMGLALHLSQGLALVMLIFGGAVLGRYAGGSPWRYGLGLGAIGAGLIAAILALGG